jgi:hypothetical protein
VFTPPGGPGQGFADVKNITEFLAQFLSSWIQVTPWGEKRVFTDLADKLLRGIH